MKVPSFVLIFSAAIAFLAAQEPPAKSPGKCSIEGQVVKAGTSEPLKKAAVVLRKEGAREPPRSAIADAAGHFLLKDVDAGRYRLRVERNGYVDQEYGARAPGQSGSILTLEPGRRLRDLLFRMVPSAVIDGRVFDEDGEPIAGVRIEVLHGIYVRGRRRFGSVAGGGTNDLGEYRIWGLAPGRYLIRAVYTPGTLFMGNYMVGGEASWDTAYAPTYYPGTPDPARASALDVRPGEEISRIDFTVLPIRGLRIRGRVFNAVTGRPGRDAWVSLLLTQSGAWLGFSSNSVVIQDAEGKFEMRGVPPGSYQLLVRWNEESKFYTARLPIEVVDQDLEGVSLIIAPGTDLAGSIRVDGGTGTRFDDFQVFLQPRDDTTIVFGGSSARVKPDGSFQLSNVPDGAFRAVVSTLPEDWYLKSCRSGTDDILSAGLNVAHGKSPGALELVLSAAGGRVEGQVLTSEDLPANGALVALVPEQDRRSRAELFKTATTDQFGRFVLKGIAPGAYELFAWEDIESGAYQDPDFLRLYEEKGKAVRVEEGSRQSVDLKLIPARTP